MSDPELHPEYDDQLAQIGDAEAAESSGMFVIDNLSKANWAVRKLAVYAAKLAEAEAFAQRERDRLDVWLAGEREAAAESSSFLSGLLRRYHEDRLAEDPKAKTIHLPAGDLTARKSPDRVDVDVPRFVMAQPEGSPFVRVVREPKKTELLKHIKATGEVPDGVALVEGEVSFKVKPRVVEQ